MSGRSWEHTSLFGLENCASTDRKSEWGLEWLIEMLCFPKVLALVNRTNCIIKYVFLMIPWRFQYNLELTIFPFVNDLWGQSQPIQTNVGL